MTRVSFVGLLVLAFAGVAGPAQGQGWYLGSELGAHVVPDLGMTGLSNDRASVCDEFINPQVFVYRGDSTSADVGAEFFLNSHAEAY